MPENLHISITGDNQGFVRALDGARAGVRATAREVEQSGGSIEQMFSRIKIAATGALAGFSAREFVQKVTQVRGQFQQLEAAFATLLGNAGKASVLMSEMADLAARTPFDLQGVADGARQLLAYGVASDEVTDTLTRLGDIAAGLSIPLGDLVYLYGTTITQGRMFTQDLRQFMGRGIPMAEELAKQFGVTKDKVGELVTAGKVGSEEVKKAIRSMTDEGGKFGGLMDAQSKTISGQVANIEDAVDMMFNNIGKQQEGIINGALGVVSDLVESYEQVGKAIAGLVATYGTYKAAVMAVTAIEKLRVAGVGALTVAETAHYGAIVLVEKAQKLLNATMLSNPYVVVATAIAGLAAVMVTMKSQQDLVNEAASQYSREKDEAIKKEQEHAAEIDRLCRAAGDESLSTDSRNAALVRLEQQYPSIFKKYDTQIEKLSHIRDINKEIAELEGRRSKTNAEGELASIDKEIRRLEGKGEHRFKFDTYGNLTDGGRTRAEEARLTMLRNRRGELSRQLSRQSGDDYLKDLTGVSNAELQKQINERKSLLSKMSVTGHGRGLVRHGGAQGTYSRDELQGQLQTLQAELNRRKRIVSDGSKDFVAEARKAYAKEKKALADLRSLTDPKRRSRSMESVDIGGARKKVSELTPEEYADAVAARQKSVDEAAKKLKSLTGQSVTPGRNAGNGEGDALRRAERLREEAMRLEEQAGKQRLETFYAQEEARIAAIANGAERERAERELQHRKDLDQIDRQERDFRKQNYEHNKTVYENSGKGNENKYTKGVNDKENDLTAGQRAQIDALRKKAKTDWEQYLLDQRKAEAQALDGYLKEYGTMQERRLAIAREYDGRIAEAHAEGERLTLQAQKAKALSDFDTANAKDDLDWTDVFGSLASFTKEQLGAVKERLVGMLSADGLDVEGYKEVVAQIGKANDAILNAEDRQRGFLGVSVSYNTERRKLEMDVADALDRQNRAMQDMAGASASLDMRKQSVQQLLQQYGVSMAQGDIRTANAGIILGQTGDRHGNGSEPYARVREELEKLAAAEAAYNEAVRKNKKATEDSAAAQRKLDTYLADFAAVLKGLMPLFEQLNANIQDIPELLSTLGVSSDSSLGKAAASLADGANASMSALQDYMSGNYVGAAANAMKAVGSYVQSATSLFAGAGNAEAMEREIAKLSDANADLASAIDNLAESIADADNTNEQSVEAYRKAVEAAGQRQANQQAMMGDRASEYANSGYGFLGMGGKHSFNVYANRNKGGWLDAFNQALKNMGSSATLGRAEDVWGLSPEEMKALQAYAPKAWTSFFDSGGVGNPKELAEEYIQMAGQLEELTESLNEKLTGYSWDGFKDSYLSLLQDLESDTADFADHINETISNALLSSVMNDEFKDRIKAIYDSLADAVSDDDLTDKEIEKIREMNKSLSDDMVKRRQQLIDLGLITGAPDTGQSATANGVSSITYDQANQYIGLVTAGNVIAQNISDGVSVAVGTLASLNSCISSRSETLVEMRNLMIFGNSYLEDTLKCVKSIYNDFSLKLDKANDYLKEMK